MYNHSEFFCAPTVSKKALNRFYSNFKAHEDELHVFAVYENGAMLVRSASEPYRTTDKREVYSLSKSFCSTAIGLLIDEGKLSEDDRIIDLFPDLCPEVISENLASMRLRHVMSMNCGHDDCVMPAMEWAENAAKAFLAQPVPYVPGTHFAYNTGATCLLSCIVQRKSGVSLLDYLTPRLFQPLGITDVKWNRTADGTCEGGIGLHICIDDIIKLGTLYLQNGIWGGKRILSEHWVKAASSPVSDNSSNGSIDWCSGYGYQFWVNARDGFRGDGACGQLCIVLPKYNTVVAVQGCIGDMQHEMDEIFRLVEHIHDDDGDENVPVLLPNYIPEPSPTRLTGHEGTLYCLEKNSFGQNSLSFSFDTENNALRLIFSDGSRRQILSAGSGKYMESTVTIPYFKPKLCDIMRSDAAEECRVACTYAVNGDELDIQIRHLTCPNPIPMKITFAEDTLTITFDEYCGMHESVLKVVGTAMQ